MGGCMNSNKTVVINGSITEMNVSGMLDLSDPVQVKKYNETMKKQFKKSFSCGIGIKNFSLGNIVDKITTYTGIKKLIKLVFKECGCEKRRVYLNKWNVYLPYVFVKFNLTSQFKELEVAPKSELRIGHEEAIPETPIPRAMVKKAKSGCGCNKKFNK